MRLETARRQAEPVRIAVPPAPRPAEDERVRAETLELLAATAERRLGGDGRHGARVAANASRVATLLDLPPEDVDAVGISARLHDVGKTCVPADLLQQQRELTPSELATVRRHTTFGAALLSGAHTHALRVAERVALTHHERWDGRGYHGLERTAIPQAARIVSVADVFDALIHARCYKCAWPVDQAVEHVAAASGTMFDPEVVEAFLLVAGSAGVLVDPAAAGDDVAHAGG